MFLCSHVVKEVSVDHFLTGCEIERRTILDESISISADDLPSLFSKVCEAYGTSNQYASVAVDGKDRSWLEVNRLENDDGDVPSSDEMLEFMASERTLYVADYSFLVQRVESVSREEIQAAMVGVIVGIEC